MKSPDVIRFCQMANRQSKIMPVGLIVETGLWRFEINPGFVCDKKTRQISGTLLTDGKKKQAVNFSDITRIELVQFKKDSRFKPIVDWTAIPEREKSNLKLQKERIRQ